MYHPPYVGSMGGRDWAGYTKGLRYLDRIIEVDGQAVRTGKDVLDHARQLKPGTPVRYKVKAGSEILEVTIPVANFGWKDFFLVFLAPFLGGLILYALGFVVYVLKPNMKSSWVFLGLCFFTGTYMITGFDFLTSHVLLHLHILAIPLFPATFFHLGLIFPERKQVLARWPRLEYLVYLPALVLALLYQIYFLSVSGRLSPSTLKWLLDWRQLSTIARIAMLFCALSLVAFQFHTVLRSSNSVARQRARLILFGVTFAFMPIGLIMFIVFTMKLNIPWNYPALCVLFFPAAIGYSIVKHNLFEADVIIKRTVGYVLVTAVVIGAYVVVSLALNVYLEQYQLAQSQWFPIVFTLIVILIFNPLRDRIQALVDRVFFRKEYDYGAILEKVGEAMTSLLEMSQVLERLVQIFMEDMFINTASVMLLTPDGKQFQVCLADGEKKQDIENKTLKRDEPLIKIIESKKREMTKYDVMEDPEYAVVSESSTANFEALHASLMIPLIYQEQVIGSMNLGEKKSGKAFNREDIDLLRTLAHQGAVALENARLFQENLEKQRMEEELNIARDLQMSMLPATCPEIRTFNIAASSTPAREVGGDFYDFIEIGEKKVGMVIADVTGKSVSGALVMSSSRTAFRMLSEEHLPVNESMMRANRRLKKDVKAGMFVALLFAVFNAEDRTVTLCSAGQTQPIHLCAKTGEAQLVETAGDKFPLGILEDANYEETLLQLEPGDKMILYTDGIVEAMNAQQEIFGFERLLEVIQTAQSTNSDGLLKKILDRVDSFVGSAEQHDDLTVIVVSVVD